jgi:chromosomal replication initiation ATPase DnaA
MKARKVNPAEVEKANNILQLVADVKQLPVEVIKSDNSTKPVSYARSLAVYSILTNTNLQWYLIAGMFGFSSVQGAIHYCYHKIKDAAVVYDDVRADLIHISNQLKLSA